MKRTLHKSVYWLVTVCMVIMLFPITAEAIDTGGDTTPPGIVSLTATKDDSTAVTSEDNASLNWAIGDTVDTITILMSEAVVFAGSTTSVEVKMVGTSGDAQTAIPSSVTYGTVEFDASDTTNRTLVVTPNTGNETAGFLGTVTFSIVPDTIEDTAGNDANATFTLNILKPGTVYVNNTYLESSCGGHSWGIDAFATIQEGINAVREEGTVNVSATTNHYFEHILISKTITLSGTPDVDENLPVIDGEDTGVVVSITADDVTLSGFHVQKSGIDTDANSDNKVEHLNAGIALQGADDCTIENNMIYDCSSGIALIYATNNTIQNNNLGDIGAYGIILSYATDPSTTPSTGNTISDNLIEVCGLDGVYVDIECDSNTIDGNTITGTGTGTVLAGSADDLDGNGIYIWKSGTNTVTDNIISGNVNFGVEIMGSANNTFSGNTVTGNTEGGFIIRYSSYPDGTYPSSPNTINQNKIYDNGGLAGYELCADPEVTSVDATYNWWGTAVKSEVDAGISGTEGTVAYIPYYINSDMTATSGDTVYVNPTYTTELACEADGYTLCVNAFAAIQDAVDAAAEGGTIYVAAGTYYENLIISQSVTLIGDTDNPAATVIDGSGDAGTGIVVNITSDNVTVKGFTVQNSGTNLIVGSSPVNPGFAMVDVSDCTVSDNIITDVVNGVVLTSTSSGTADSERNVVDNNDITMFYGYGVVLQAYYPSDVSPVVHSVNNTVISNNSIDVACGKDGIYADRECDYSVIQYNAITFSPLWGDGAAGFNHGIYFWKSGNNTVIGNTITNCGFGIRMKSSSNNVLKGNTLYNNGYGIVITSSGYSDVRSAYPATENNYISYNNIYCDEYTAPYLYILGTGINVSTVNGDAIDVTNNYWGDSITNLENIESLVSKETEDLVVEIDPYFENPVHKITYISDASNLASPDDNWFESNVAIGTLPTLTRTGYAFGGWYTAQNGAGTKYTGSTAMPASDVTLYAYWYIPAGAVNPPDTGVPVIIDGHSYSIGEAETNTDAKTGVQTTVVTVNESGFNAQIGAAAEGSSVVVPIPAQDGSTSGKAVLTAEMVNNAATKEMTIEVQSGEVSYVLPADAVDTGGLAETFGTGSALGDIEIDITITELSANDVTIENGTLVLPPVSFSVTATYNGQTVEIERFTDYVDRFIEIPEGVDPESITTAIVIGADGSENHVPTEVVYQNGQWYAIIHSRTNSTYALVNNEVTFSDAVGQWYEDAVNELGSRMIINGVGDEQFAGDSSVTRAEFAAILVRALGLPTDSMAASIFADVGSSEWYYGAVGTAYEYGVVAGVSSTEFAPTAYITRQEAMAMVYRAAAIADYAGTNGSLSSFSDADTVSSWAALAAQFNVGSGLIVGSDGRLCPHDEISRAETATVVLRLLQTAALIDIRTEA